MIKEAIGTGATVEEAKEKALAALGARPEDDVKVEIVEMPKKKILGIFGGADAQVRAYVELPDEKPKKQKNKPEKKQEKNKSEKKSEVKPENKPQNKPENKPAEQVAAPKKETPSAAQQSIEDDYKDAVDFSAIDPASRAAKAVNYLQTVLEKLGCSGITYKVAERENGAFIILDGEGLGGVIGHRGETLDALQYLAGLVANNGGGYYKVSLNIGNYRERRAQTLVALAQRVSAQVLQSGRSRALEPMNPYERRIIHTAVQEIEGVVSNSIGEGSGRRVVIAPKDGDSRPPRRDDGRGGRGRGGKGGKGGHERRPSNTVATAPTREPKKDSDTPLYGKIG